MGKRTLTAHARVKRAERIARVARRMAVDRDNRFRDLQAAFLYSIGPYATRDEAHRAILSALARNASAEDASVTKR